MWTLGRADRIHVDDVAEIGDIGGQEVVVDASLPRAAPGA